MVFKVYSFLKHAFLLMVQLLHWQNKTNEMVFSTEDLVLIEVLCQEKGYDIDE